MKHNKGGRPPLDPSDQSVRVSLSLTARRYDEIYRAARASRMSISEYLRHRLSPHKLQHPPSPR